MFTTQSLAAGGSGPPPFPAGDGRPGAVPLAIGPDDDDRGLLRGGRALAVRQLALHLKDLPDGAREAVVVDVGVGVGVSLVELAAQLVLLPNRVIVYGIDTAAASLGLARWNVPVLRPIHDDAARIGRLFPAGSVDLALLHFVTPFVDARQVIADVASTLRPGGLLSLVSTTGASFSAIKALAPTVIAAEQVRGADAITTSAADLRDLLLEPGLDVIAEDTAQQALRFASVDELSRWGQQSGFFRHLRASSSSNNRFPLDDHFQATALLARKPR